MAGQNRAAFTGGAKHGPGGALGAPQRAGCHDTATTVAPTNTPQTMSNPLPGPLRA
jgi:hypothetical protein